ncbi:ATP-binding cassette domain-containing protein [Anaerosporobacter sp.]
MKYELRLEDVTKRHEGLTIVENMSLAVKKSTVIGIVGSTYEKASMFMQLLAGEIVPCQGEIYYQDENLSKYGQVPGYVGVYISDIGFLTEYTGYKNLKYIAGMNEKAGEEDIHKAMTLVGLSPTNNRKVLQYSSRMRQKLSIAQAIMEGQKMLLIDAGVFTTINKENHTEIRKILSKLKKLGYTMGIASEKEEYIKKICDQIIHI